MQAAGVLAGAALRPRRAGPVGRWRGRLGSRVSRIGRDRRWISLFQSILQRTLLHVILSLTGQY